MHLFCYLCRHEKIKSLYWFILILDILILDSQNKFHAL